MIPKTGKSAIIGPCSNKTEPQLSTTCAAAQVLTESTRRGSASNSRGACKELEAGRGLNRPVMNSLLLARPRAEENDLCRDVVPSVAGEAHHPRRGRCGHHSLRSAHNRLIARLERLPSGLLSRSKRQQRFQRQPQTKACPRSETLVPPRTSQRGSAGGAVAEEGDVDAAAACSRAPNTLLSTFARRTEPPSPTARRTRRRSRAQDTCAVRGRKGRHRRQLVARVSLDGRGCSPCVQGMDTGTPQKQSQSA